MVFPAAGTELTLLVQIEQDVTLLHSDEGSKECMKAKLRKALCPLVPKSPLVLIKGVVQKFAISLITLNFHLSCG